MGGSSLFLAASQVINVVTQMIFGETFEKENFFNHGYVYLILKYYKSKRLHVLTDTFQIFIGPRFKVCVRAIQIT